MTAKKIWLIWSVYTILWTTALVIPGTATRIEGIDELISPYKIFLAKGLHVCAYGVMTVLTGHLPVPPRYRWLLMFLLMGHATGTELIQDGIPALGRSGHLYDVAFDHLGIALGLLLSWQWWTRE